MNGLKLISAITVLVAALLCGVFSPPVHAEANCPPESRITRDFDNGARWDLCWDSRIRENLVLSDIHYTPPGRKAFKVLGSARLSQLHVAYDDSDVTYNDITQYGLGGSYLVTLTPDDCPDGELLNVQTRPAICLRQTRASNGYRTPTRAEQSASIQLFSVSQVGAYAYIVSWMFYDDGTFEPGVGATGALQRSSDDVTEPYGRVLQGDPDTLWLSHTHNYYWRLDFDLGASANDDVATELGYSLDAQGTRSQDKQVFDREQARRIDPSAQLLWRVMDDSSDSAAGYQIEPVRTGHRFERTTIEPYSEYDFFVTVAKDCERFASQNARFNPDCRDDVLQFTDGQSLLNADIIVWNRVSFHHTPRSEDQRNMHTHWDDFRITPVNLLSGTSNFSSRPNSPPEFAALPNQQTGLDVLVHTDMISASDPDNDILSYVASGLPPGLAMRIDGHVHGYPQAPGRYTVIVTARDDQSMTQTSFDWLIGDPVVTARESSGSLSYATGLALLLFSIGKLCLLLRREASIADADHATST